MALHLGLQTEMHLVMMKGWRLASTTALSLALQKDEQ